MRHERELRVLTLAGLLLVDLAAAPGASAQRSPARRLAFAPATNAVLSWPAAERELLAHLRRAKVHRYVSSGVANDGLRARRIRSTPAEISFSDTLNPGVRRIVSLRDGDMALVSKGSIWIAEVSVATDRGPGEVCKPSDYCGFYFASRAEAEAFLQALHDARVAAHSEPAPTADPEAEFAARAAAWRARDPKPRLSAVADEHRVLAEGAIRAREYFRAIDEFEAALQANPTWPSGNFNLALLYEAVGDWKEAARFMRRFLLLEPDSREATPAREKIILWEDNARRALATPE